MTDDRTPLMDAALVMETLRRMGREIVESVPEEGDFALLGIHRRGVQLAQILAYELRDLTGREIPTGSLDITLYRDDLMAIGPRPVVGETRLPAGGVDGRPVVIVDDVLYTGRTVRAALDELADFGRPTRTLLAVLIDRGERELPIQPDIVGETVDVPRGRLVEVAVPELDGRLGVDLVAAAGG